MHQKSSTITMEIHALDSIPFHLGHPFVGQPFVSLHQRMSEQTMFFHLGGGRKARSTSTLLSYQTFLSEFDTFSRGV
jgi:hypothetical protein